jgi:large subunit ribosomal protein L10
LAVWKEVNVTRKEKLALVKEMSESFEKANGIVFCDYKGMTVFQIEKLRNISRDKSVGVKVVKNKLAMIALNQAGKEGVVLKDTNLLLWAEDIVDLAKLATEFEKENSAKFHIKGGYFEGGVVEATQVEAYSKLASREEFLGMLLSTWTAPIRNTLYVWTGVQRQWVTVLSNIQDKKSA